MALDPKKLQLIGGRIRESRKRAGKTQERLAEETGLSPIYIGRLERGEKQPSLEVLSRLSESLEVSVLDLLIDLDPRLNKDEIKSRIRNLLDLL